MHTHYMKPAGAGAPKQAIRPQAPPRYLRGGMVMKKLVTVFTIMLCIAIASPVFARGYSHGRYSHGGYSHHGGHNHTGIGIAFGLAGGLLLGSALAYSAAPPPRTVVYGPYPPDAVVVQPGVCLEDQTVYGEWRVNRYTGRQVWVSFPYPEIHRYQVPCR